MTDPDPIEEAAKEIGDVQNLDPIEFYGITLEVCQRLYDASKKAGAEEAARHWDDTETRAAEAHGVYMLEARRQGDVRHKDSYADLSEPIKEFDRVLVRWVAASLRARVSEEGGR